MERNIEAAVMLLKNERSRVKLLNTVPDDHFKIIEAVNLMQEPFEKGLVYTIGFLLGGDDIKNNEHILDSIFWWLYEEGEKIVRYDDGILIDLSEDAEKLVEFLIETAQ